MRVSILSGWMRWIGGCMAMASLPVCAQIDPIPRNLIHFGYNQPVEGKAPFAAYGFYYHNNPRFRSPDRALRVVVAPVYLDAELGFRSVLGPHTDLGLGLSGGGFAWNHAEIRRGRWIRGESFTGHGGEMNLSLYHTFNPLPDGREPSRISEVPLQGILRVSGGGTAYVRDGATHPDFVVPEPFPGTTVRAGLRWGGREPEVSPKAAAEASVWYQGVVRWGGGEYGFARDREVERMTHLFLARTLLAYTLEERGDHFEVSLTGGAALDADRLNVFRIGGTLPFAAEFPLMLPGYFFEELSARRFAVLHGWYAAPVTGRLEFLAQVGVAFVDYLPGLEQPGHWHSGLGGGFGWTSASGAWQVVGTYAYGLDAIRSDGRGAHLVGVLLQVDLDAGAWRTRVEGEDARPWMRRVSPASWRGFQRFLRW